VGGTVLHVVDMEASSYHLSSHRGESASETNAIFAHA
jgi:hypothetical protein